MDSINKNQPEDNFKDLSGNEAREKIKELATAASSGFFCTGIKTGMPINSRPMSHQQIDDEGNFWYLSANDSHKNREIAADPAVQLFFQGSSYSDFLSLYGNATISADAAKIDELWDDTLKTWFTEGKHDPRISVIKFAPSEGYYWDLKNNMIVAMAKRAYGAITGQTYDDSIEGNVKP
ncbi:pyridoxamine 5'-phosphate oxidase family protein [Flavobacterium sp. 3HN19-14]|uniref:pyridoxamine 5'-phosphate oxidase family protein n=1 Tax=Flavobacterium sp. 3HN19-14 TaxID=3448133 RepID=UPI003EDF6FEE